MLNKHWHQSGERKNTSCKKMLQKDYSPWSKYWLFFIQNITVKGQFTKHEYSVNLYSLVLKLYDFLSFMKHRRFSYFNLQLTWRVTKMVWLPTFLKYFLLCLKEDGKSQVWNDMRLSTVLFWGELFILEQLMVHT